MSRISQTRKILVGVSGGSGAGKSEFASILYRKYRKHVQVVRFSSVLDETLQFWNIPVTLRNLTHLCKTMTERFGDDALARAVYRQIENCSANVVVLDGIRSYSDLKVLRMSPANIFVYISASPKIRFKRVQKRHERIDESSLSYEEFLANEEPTREQQILTLGSNADFTITNDYSYSDFSVQITRFSELYIKDYVFL